MSESIQALEIERMLYLCACNKYKSVHNVNAIHFNDFHTVNRLASSYAKLFSKKSQNAFSNTEKFKAIIDRNWIKTFTVHIDMTFAINPIFPSLILYIRCDSFDILFNQMQSNQYFTKVNEIDGWKREYRKLRTCQRTYLSSVMNNIS